MEQTLDKNSIAKINPVAALNNLKKLNPPQGCEWGVFTTVLNLSANKKHAKNPDLFGYVIPLGSYKNKEKAEKAAKKIMEKSGCQTVTVCQYGSLFPIGLKSFEKESKNVLFDNKGKLIDMQCEYDEKIKEYFEKQQEKEEEYKNKCEKEKDVNSVEYIKMQQYFHLIDAINIAKLEKEKSELIVQLNKRKANIDEFKSKNPECGESWWKLLEEDFSDNLPHLEILKAKYQELNQ